MIDPKGATPLDVDGLRLSHLRSREEIYAAEAENIFRAHQRHLARRKNAKREWLTDDFLRRLHRDMFGAVWEWAGQYRNTEKTVGVAPFRIRDEIAKLCKDRLYWDQDETMSILDRAARLHARLAWIHPFENGNGRHARLVTDLFLRSHGHALPEWPHSDLMGDGAPRLNYLAALKSADQGNFEPLINFTKQYLR